MSCIIVLHVRDVGKMRGTKCTFCFIKGVKSCQNFIELESEVVVKDEC